MQRIRLAAQCHKSANGALQLFFMTNQKAVSVKFAVYAVSRRILMPGPTLCQI